MIEPKELVSELTLPLQAEQIAISRQLVEGDTVRVETVTHEHDHDVDETIYKENVEVQHIPIGREIFDRPEIVRDGDLTIIPIVEEVLVVSRKLILKEEIHLRRTRTAEQHQETVVLRHQKAVVTREAPAGSSNTNDIDLNPGEVL